MIQWRQRLYAFLLRRILGPFLTPQSNSQLSQCIEVSFQEGRFVLKDVELDPEKINDYLISAPVSVQRVGITKLEIVLSLRAGDDSSSEGASGDNSGGGGGIMRSVISDFPSSSSGWGLSASIKIDGVIVEFVPSPPCETTATTTIPPPPSSSPAYESPNPQPRTSSIMSSMIDAALSSLRLTVTVSNVETRLYDAFRENCIVVSLQTLSYRDWDCGEEGERRQESNNASSCYDVFQKLIDIGEITIFNNNKCLVNDNNRSSDDCILKTEGTGQVYLRVVAQGDGENVTLRHDVNISLSQRVEVLLDDNRIRCLLKVAQGVVVTAGDEEMITSEEMSGDGDSITSSSFSAKEEEGPATSGSRALEGIMKQYAEARHLARTKEVRGGILLPNDDEKNMFGDDNMTSFDAFFDCNSTSFSNYMSMMHSVHHDNEGSGISKKEEGFWKVGFHLLEGSVRLVFPEAEEYCMLAFNDFYVSGDLSGGGERVNLSVDISHLEIEDCVTSDEGTDVGSLLRFVEEINEESCLVAPPACISVSIRSSPDNHNQSESNHNQGTRSSKSEPSKVVEIRLQPIEILPRHRTLLNLSQLSSCVSSPEEKSSSTALTDSTSKSLLLSVYSPQLTLLFPINADKISQNRITTLFSRHAHPVYDTSHNTTLFGLSLTPISIDVLPPSHSKISSNMTLTTHSASLFITTPHSPSSLLIKDIISFSGEPLISSDSVVTIAFSSQARMGTSGETAAEAPPFPILHPLRTVKCRQEGLVFEKNCIGGMGMRADDPQQKMMEQAETCDSILEVSIPYITFDVTVEERVALLEVLSVGLELPSSSKRCNNDDDKDGASVVGRSIKRPMAGTENVTSWGVALNSEQMVFILSQDVDTFVLIADGFKSFVTLDGNGLKNARVFTKDLTLYEATLHSSPAVGLNISSSILPFCKHFTASQLRQRGLSTLKQQQQKKEAVVTPVFYRSKLSYPLSPSTPCFHVDLLKDDDSDITIHVNFYDMTYRYSLESTWFRRFIAVLQGCGDNATDEAARQDSRSKDVNTSGQGDDEEEEEFEYDDDDDDDDDETFTRLFVTFSDCTLDYTPPHTFTNSKNSRMMLRFGEIHISSNIVSSSSSTSHHQAYKASFADAGLYLCNKRFPYTLENAQLSCAQRLLKLKKNVSDLHEWKPYWQAHTQKSLEDVLDLMHFVNVASLDSCDVYFKLNNNALKVTNAHPAVQVNLTMGLLSLFVCRDSFRCLTEMYGEWSLVFLGVSDDQVQDWRQKEEEEKEKEELETKRKQMEAAAAEALRKQKVEQDSRNNDNKNSSKSDNGNDGSHRPYANVPDSELSATELRQKYSYEGAADDVASHLAKSLLIKNFYTMDTTRHENEQDTSYSRREADSLFSNKICYFEEEEEDEEPLGGHDWTTVDHKWTPPRHHAMEDEPLEQRATWFPMNDDSNNNNNSNNGMTTPLQIYPQHIPLSQTQDVLSEQGDLGAAKFAKLKESPPCQMRLLLKQLSINCRFFDGCDWEIVPRSSLPSKSKGQSRQRQQQLLSALLSETNDNDDGSDDDGEESFLPPVVCPLKKNRSENKFFQLSLSEMRLRHDSFPDENVEHRLGSCMKMTIMDLFLAESISQDGRRVRKMMGEWVNDEKHPRDSYDGVLMMKMVSMHPTTKFTPEGKLKADEGSVVLDLLPLRCHIDQSAMRFVRHFFSSDDASSSSSPNTDDESATQDNTVLTHFRQFKVNPCKLKVNYIPVGMDVKSLKEGSYVEILNLFPLEDMELLLQTVHVRDVVGWGDAISEMLSMWIEDICQTQMHKFLTGAAPFHSLSAIGGELVDFVCIPVHHYKHKNSTQIGSHGNDSLTKRVRRGTSSVAGTVALETLNTTSKLTHNLAKVLDKASPINTKLLPRPDKIPVGLSDTAEHAVESLLRGVRSSHYTIVVVPQREYHRRDGESGGGVTGALKSVVRAIPVAVLAPLSGASEAISYVLLGARNQIRPDIRREEEADLRGLL